MNARDSTSHVIQLVMRMRLNVFAADEIVECQESILDDNHGVPNSPFKNRK